MEGRIERRRQIIGNGYGKVFSKRKLNEIEVSFIDVSENGLGLAFLNAAPEGHEFLLVVGEQTIDLELMWVKADKEGYRCGLKQTTPRLNLDACLT